MPKLDSAIKINYMCIQLEQMQSYRKKSGFQHSNDAYYDDQLFSIGCRFFKS